MKAIVSVVVVLDWTGVSTAVAYVRAARKEDRRPEQWRDDCHNRGCSIMCMLSTGAMPAAAVETIGAGGTEIMTVMGESICRCFAFGDMTPRLWTLVST